MSGNRKIIYIAFALLMFSFAPLSLQATTVLQVDMDYLLDRAMLIFEGEVVSSEAKWNDDKTSINTFITFRVKDILKGRPRASTVVLGFSGGTVGGTGLEVSGMVYPDVGERGIYFIENAGQQFVNPMVGWGQGHFRIKQDNYGQERVFTEGGLPVLSLDISTMNHSHGTGPGKHSISPFSHGVAEGVRTGRRDDPLNTAMGKKSFKDALKAHLATVRTKTGTRFGSAGK